jgi:hypothetical protein
VYKKLLLFCTFFMLADTVQAKVVLGNFNQPSTGQFFTTRTDSWTAVPFTTDGTYLTLTQIETLAVTITTPPSRFFVQIRDVDAFARPNNTIGTLSGSQSPSGYSTYTGSIILNPNTSYFVVYGVHNGGGQHWSMIVDTPQADIGENLFQFGTDIDSNGSVDLNSQCSGGLNDLALEKTWQCGGVINSQFFIKTRITAIPTPAPIVPAAVSLSASSHHFANVNVGNSMDYAMSVTNTGGSDLIIGALSSDNVVFTLVNDTCSGQTVTATNSCTVDIRFTPASQGAVNGHISIPSNAASSPDIVAVSGHGDLPVAFLSTSHLSFGSQLINVTSPGQIVTLTDNGGATLNVVSVTSNDTEFSVINDNCSGQAITSGNNCTFEVQFTPNQANGRSGTISVVSNSASSPDNISVDGTGLNSFGIHASPTFLDFGNQNVDTVSAPQSIILTNTGTGDLTFTSIQLSNNYLISQDDCSGQTILSGNTCLIEIVFRPIHDGYISSTLIINSDHPDSPHGIILLGTGVSVSVFPIPVNSKYFIFILCLLILISVASVTRGMKSP